MSHYRGKRKEKRDGFERKRQPVPDELHPSGV
jgi:hypothetical protein